MFIARDAHYSRLANRRSFARTRKLASPLTVRRLNWIFPLTSARAFLCKSGRLPPSESSPPPISTLPARPHPSFLVPIALPFLLSRCSFLSPLSLPDSRYFRDRTHGSLFFSVILRLCACFLYPLNNFFFFNPRCAPPFDPFLCREHALAVLLAPRRAVGRTK